MRATFSPTLRDVSPGKVFLLALAGFLGQGFAILLLWLVELSVVAVLLVTAFSLFTDRPVVSVALAVASRLGL